MYNLQDIKNEYYHELEHGETRGFDQYIAECYVACYDAELNFLGYERG